MEINIKNAETLKDYQLGNLKDLDFFKIFELFETIKKDETINSEVITKSYVNSLFTPLLSFSINYLNENEEKEGVIGKSFIENLEVIYLILNKNIYDLFFQRKKGSIFGSKNTLNYERREEEDNYLVSFIEEEKEFNSEMLENLVLLGEKNIDENETLKEIFNFKKKEIISGFRLGYSIQERIINTLKSNSNNNIFELPNVIFYKKNKDNKIYNEVDRIITVKKDTVIKNFMVFSKAKFQKDKNPITIKASKDETLILQNDSCNFIEVKTSMNYLLNNENNQIKSNYFKSKTLSEISSIHSGKKSEKITGIKMFNNIGKFIALFKNFNKHFKKINFIIILDSYFQKRYIKSAEEFVMSIPKQKFDFNLIFVHIDSDITYACELDKYQKIEEELQNKVMEMKNDSDIKNKEIKLLKNDSYNKRKEIEQLKEDSKNKDKKILDLSNKMVQMQKELDKLLRQNKEREIEEIIRKEKYDKYIDNIFKENEIEIKNSKYNYIIGEYYKDSFTTMSYLISSKIQFNYLIDFKTFIRLIYSKENLSLINDIENKHFYNLKKISQLNVNKLILLVDFVFILNINKIMSLYFKNKELTIKCANNGLYILFLLFFKDKTNSINESPFLLKENILSYEQINLNKISNLYNFINYYYEINDSMTENNLDNFPIYNPIIGINQYFFSIKTTACQNDDILALLCGPFLDYEDLTLDKYGYDYKYIIILSQSYDFKCDENVCNLISKFYFKKEPEFILRISDNIKVIFDNEGKYLTFFGESSVNNVALIDKQKGRVQFKFRVKNESTTDEEKYIIDVKNIIDKNIKIILDKIILQNKKDIDILIEESFNIIYSYINNVYKISNIVLLNGDKKDVFNKIKKMIATNKKIEIKEYLLEFLNKKKDSKFDLIISTNNLYLEDENSAKHKFLKRDKLTNIKNHLKEKGIFCFYLFLNNMYLKEKIMEKLETVFDKENISIYNHKLDYIIICRNN